MSEPESTASPAGDDPAADFAIPVLEIRFDSFDELLQQAAPELLASRLPLDSADELAVGDLERLVIRVCDQPVSIRALGRVVELAGDPADEEGEEPNRALDLICIDPASHQLIESIRMWHPELREPVPDEDDGLDASGSEDEEATSEASGEVEWELDVDSLIGEAFPEPAQPMLESFDDLTADPPEAGIEPNAEPDLTPELEAPIQATYVDPQQLEDEAEQRAPPDWASPDWQPPLSELNAEDFVKEDDEPAQPSTEPAFEPNEGPVAGTIEEPLEASKPERLDKPGTDARYEELVPAASSAPAPEEAVSRRPGLLSWVAVLLASLGIGFGLHEVYPRLSTLWVQPQKMPPGPLSQSTPLTPAEDLTTPSSTPPPAEDAAEPLANDAPSFAEANPSIQEGAADGRLDPTAEANGDPDPMAEIEETLQGWARAWSEQQVDEYLAYYAPDYSPPNMNHAAWKSQRRQRIEAPTRLAVSLGEVEILALEDDRATVQFFQIYLADTVRRTTWKTFELRRDTVGWTIYRETLGRP
ncbi:MAG: hypothetical protein AAF657_01795 [Acidobacteriota bacterium]